LVIYVSKNAAARRHSLPVAPGRIVKMSGIGGQLPDIWPVWRGGSMVLHKQ